MGARLRALALAVAAPLMLWSCVVAPGKFVSTLTILKDRSFAFTYQGEVYALDLGSEFSKGMLKGFGDTSDDKKTSFEKTALQDDKTDKDETDSKAETERKNAAIADALRKEAGFRRVDYLGDGKFVIDYAAAGSLSHTFVWPFNVDAEIVFPFLAIELRGRDGVRVKAPAFAAQGDNKNNPAANGITGKLDGTFTLVTDGEVVSQNNEAGAVKGADGRSTITWKATPLSKDAPLAVLKVAPLP